MMPELPNSLEAETSVLSGIFNDPENSMDLCLSRLNVDDFWSRTNQIIYRTMVDLSNDRKVINKITVSDRLKSDGKLEEVGGDYHLFTITNGFNTSAHTHHFVEMIREKAKLRRLVSLSHLIQSKALDGVDSNEIIPEIEQLIFGISNESSGDENQLLEGLEEVRKRVGMDANSSEAGMKVSLAAWNRVTGGIKQGRYYVLGGRPSSGKTAMAEQIATDFLLAGKPVLFISREMRRDRILARMACRILGACHSDYDRGFLSEIMKTKMYAQLDKMKNWPLHLITPTQITPTGASAMIRKEKRKHGIELAVFDYIQLIDTPFGMKEREALSLTSKQLRVVANLTGVPLLILVQLNRDAEKEQPRMGHVKECGQIEQDADVVALLSAEDEGNGTQKNINIIFDKNRDGPQTKETVVFEGRPMLFKNQNENKQKSWKDEI